MKYSLRSLMIVALVLPPLLAVAWWFFAPVEKAEFDSGDDSSLKEAIEKYERYVESRP